MDKFHSTFFFVEGDGTLFFCSRPNVALGGPCPLVRTLWCTIFPSTDEVQKRTYKKYCPFISKGIHKGDFLVSSVYFSTLSLKNVKCEESQLESNLPSVRIVKTNMDYWHEPIDRHRHALNFLAVKKSLFRYYVSFFTKLLPKLTWAGFVDRQLHNFNFSCNWSCIWAPSFHERCNWLVHLIVSWWRHD